MTERRNPRVIVVNGDVCSGSSTFARTLSNRLGYELFDVGQEFRQGLREAPERDAHELSVTLNGLVEQRIASGKNITIEGRLVGLQARGFTDVLKLLCVAPDEVVAERYMSREGLPCIGETRRVLQDRFERDERMLSDAWGVGRADVLNPTLYDKVIETSVSHPEELVLTLMKDSGMV